MMEPKSFRVLVIGSVMPPPTEFKIPPFPSIKTLLFRVFVSYEEGSLTKKLGVPAY